MSSATFKINCKPHVGQQEVLRGIMSTGADVICIDGSRGWGKSLFCVSFIALPVMLATNNTQAMWVAPTYKICRSPIDDVWFGTDEDTGERFVPQRCPKTGFKFWDYKKGDGEIHLFNNSKLFIRSADSPDSIVSKGYSLIIIDEAAQIPQDVFETQILATARRKNCKIVMISSPRGKNWFYHMYLAGQDPSKPRYVSFKQPWWKRPDYPELLKDLMKDLPAHIRKQEFDAEFIDGGGGTFTNLEKVFFGDEIRFPSDQQEWTHPDIAAMLESFDFTLAVDFAKMVDYTVITIFANDIRKMVYYRRINKRDYKFVLDIIKAKAIEFNYADVIFDATGVGSGIHDFLSTEVNVHPFVFTNKSKNEIINRLIVACEYEKIGIPNIFTIRSEFEIFEFNMTRTGKITYSAPDGKHDDTVMSIAMANWYIEENGGQTNVIEIDDFIKVINSTGQPRSFYDFMDQDND